jgi:putative ABC transport system permease protein
LVIGSLLAVLLNVAVLRIYDSAKLSAPIVLCCALLLWLVALGAALPPALRASRISPAIATRNV